MKFYIFNLSLMPNRHAKKKEKLKVAENEPPKEEIQVDKEKNSVPAPKVGGKVETGNKNEQLVGPKSIDFYPFAYALYNDYLQDYCWYCLDEDRNHKYINFINKMRLR